MNVNPRALVLLSTMMFTTAMFAWKLAGPYWVTMLIVTIVYGLFLSVVTVN